MRSALSPRTLRLLQRKNGFHSFAVGPDIYTLAYSNDKILQRIDHRDKRNAIIRSEYNHNGKLDGFQLITPRRTSLIAEPAHAYYQKGALIPAYKRLPKDFVTQFDARMQAAQDKAARSTIWQRFKNNLGLTNFVQSGTIALHELQPLSPLKRLAYRFTRS